MRCLCSAVQKYMGKDKILLDNGSRDNEFKARWIDGTIEISLNRSYDCQEKNVRRLMCFKELLLIEKRERKRKKGLIFCIQNMEVSFL